MLACGVLCRLEGCGRGLRQLQDAVGNKFVQGLVLHDHDRITPFDARLHAGPVSMLW